MIDKIKVVIFTVIVTAVFTFLVSGVHNQLKEKTLINRQVAQQRVVLSLFGLASDSKNIGDAQVPQLFLTNIEQKEIVASESKEMLCFGLKNSDKKIYVFSFLGQGFWDKIQGFMAIDLNEGKLKGIEFTQHGETPGLGGRISEKEFKARFIDKPCLNIREDGLRFKFVKEGQARSESEIDGITGATGTTVALEKIVNDSITAFISVAKGGFK